MHSQEAAITFIPESLRPVNDENGPLPLIMGIESWDVEISSSSGVSRGNLSQEVRLTFCDSLLVGRISSERHALYIDAFRLHAAVRLALFARLTLQRLGQGFEVVWVVRPRRRVEMWTDH